MTNDSVRSPSGSGHSPKGGAASASPAKQSVPNAAWAREWGDEFLRVTKVELGKSFARWSRRWKPGWWTKPIARQAYEDGFEIGARAAFQAIHEVRSAIASGILTEGGDAKQAPGESLSSPVAKPDAPTVEVRP